MPSTIPSGGGVQFAAQDSRSTLPRFIASFGELLHMAPGESEEGTEVDIAGESSANTDSSSIRRDVRDVSTVIVSI